MNLYCFVILNFFWRFLYILDHQTKMFFFRNSRIHNDFINVFETETICEKYYR